jgi:RNA polymerase sigma-70 factor (ECF subfamily)
MFRLFSTSDAQLVLQTLAGKREAFGTLVERYQPVAYAVAYARVHRHADAEDVAQESLLAAYQQLDTLRDPARFGAWLAGIARHCASRVRERRLRDATVAERHNGEEPVVMPDHERRELWELIRAEIDRLNEPDREVVLLHYFAGKSSREIASVTDSTSGAVRKRLQRARETLGSRLLERAAVPAQPDREKTQRIMGLIAAAPAAWEAAGQAGAGAVPLTGGITMSKIVGFVALVVAFIGGAYVLNQQATLPKDESVPFATVTEKSVGAPESGNADATVAASSPSSQAPETTPSGPASYPVELQAIVYDTEGRPAQSVPVNIRIFARSDLVSGRYESHIPSAEQTVRSDANGYVLARFRVASGSTNRVIAEWRAAAPGAYAYLRTTAAGPVTNRNPYPLQLIAAEPISGRISSASRTPIGGAKVRPFQFESSGGERSPLMPDGEGVSTAPDGTYVHNQLYAGRWKLLVEAPAYAGTITEFADTGTDLDVTLEPALSLSGIVIDQDVGEPISGLRIVLVRRDCWIETHETVTDDEGRYSFPSLAPAIYTVYPIDRQRFVSSDHAKIVVRQSESSYTIEMRRGAVITGRVTDSRTGQPIAGVVAAAGLVDPDTDSHPRTYMRSEPTASDGIYMIEGLPTGEYRVGFSGPSSLPPVTDAVRETLPLLDVNPGQVYSDIDFAVDRLYPVSGVVRDPEGNPLGGVSVLDYDLDRPERYRNMYMPNPTLTDADGRFIRWLPEATGKLVLRAISGKWASRDTGPMPVRAGGLDNVELIAYPAGRIFGLVKSPDGTPIPSAEVACETLNATALRDVPENERFAFGAGNVWTDMQGRFTLVGLPPDDYTFTYREVSRSVTLGPGEYEEVVIQLAADGSASVEGVALVAGEPTEGISISFSDESGGRPLSAMSNDEGRYHVSGVPGGEMQYTADWREFDHGVEISRHLNGAITVPARGLSTLDFELARGTSAIEGVLTENGNPRPRAQFIVSLQWDEATLEWIRVVTNDEGYYRIDGLPAGEHDLILDLKPSMPNDEPHSHRYFYTVNTADGQTTRHDVTFDMGSLAVSYSGIGANEQGRLVVIPDVADAEELTLPKALSLIDHALFDAEFEEDGSVSIDDVPAGTHTMLFAVYDAIAESDEARFASTRYTYSLVEVTQGKETAVSFALPQ